MWRARDIWRKDNKNRREEEVRTNGNRKGREEVEGDRWREDVERRGVRDKCSEKRRQEV